MINAHRLVYNNLSSEDFDVIPGLSFGGDDGATTSFLGKEGVYTEHYDGHHTIHRAKYNEVFVPRFTLVKKDYSDFSEEENRRILSWLTVSENPGWIEVYKDDSNVLSWRVFGCITVVEQYKLGNSRVVGYEFEVETTHPYVWSKKYETTRQISEPTPFGVVCGTDEYNKLIYPKVTITFSESNIYLPADGNPGDDAYKMIPGVIYSYKEGTNETLYININQGDETDQGRHVVWPVFSTLEAGASTVGKHYYFANEKVIKKTISVTVNDVPTYAWKVVSTVGAAVKINHSYKLNGENITKETTLAGGVLGETIVLDGTNKVISSNHNDGTKIIGDDFNFEWVSLAYGENNFSVTGDCTIKFEWIEPRKVGNL